MAISDDLAARIEDAFGLFGPPERCADRLLRAREEAGVEHVFLFPAHTLAGGYDMPEGEIEAFGRVIRPRLALIAAQPANPRGAAPANGEHVCGRASCLC